MTKQIITAETVRLAWKAGQSVITCAAGDIVTQQARDDIRYYGMQLHTDAPAPALPTAAPAPAKTPVEAVSMALAQTQPSVSQPVPTPALTAEQLASATRQLHDVLAPLTQALGASAQMHSKDVPPVVLTPGVNPMAAPVVPARHQEAPRFEQSMIASIRRKVLASLPAGTVQDTSLLDRLIQTVFTEIGADCGPMCGAVEIRPGVLQASGVLHVDSKKQLWSTSGSKDSVSMMEVLSPADGAPAAVGYLEWEKLSFPWTFTRPEVLVVLEGELTLTIEGTTLNAAHGDVFSIPGGTDVVLGSSGHVKCTTVGVAA